MLCRLQGAIHSSGNGKDGVYSLLAQHLDDLLAELAQHDALHRQFRLLRDQPNDVPLCRIGVEAEKQIRAGQVKEMQRVGLQELAHVHQLAQFLGGRRNLHSEDGVASLGRSEVMADRADAAGPAYEERHFPEQTPFADLLQSPKLDNVEPGLGHSPVIAKVEGYLAVTFYPGYWFNLNLSGHPTCLHATSDISQSASCRPAIPVSCR